jgi:hypothetical protein
MDEAARWDDEERLAVEDDERRAGQEAAIAWKPGEDSEGCSYDVVAPSEVRRLIPKSEWDSLPIRLTIGHVSALLQISPKNVRNLVYRAAERKEDRLSKFRSHRVELPPMMPKPPHRVNATWLWSKKEFLSFVEKHYGHLYD